MSVKKIVTHTHPTLRKIAEPVKEINDNINSLIKDLLDTLDGTGDLGVGLSANQIDQPVRVFVARIYPDGESSAENKITPRHFINPEIVFVSEETNLTVDPNKQFLEGCLSLPNIYGFVERPLTVTMRYHTTETLSDNKPMLEEIFDKDNSIVMQHELDHLNGILFTDHVREQGHPIYEINEDGEPRKLEL